MSFWQWFDTSLQIMSRIIIIKNRKKTYIVIVVLAVVGHVNGFLLPLSSLRLETRHISSPICHGDDDGGCEWWWSGGHTLWLLLRWLVVRWQRRLKAWWISVEKEMLTAWESYSPWVGFTQSVNQRRLSLSSGHVTWSKYTKTESFL